MDDRAGVRRAGLARPRRWYGQSLTELALMLPLLSLILVGAIDLGRVFFYYTRLTNAVREGAAYGTQYPDETSQIQDRVKAEGSLVLATTDISVTCYSKLTTTVKTCVSTTSSGPGGGPSGGTPPPSTAAGAGDSIEVTAYYTFKPLTARIVGILPANYQIRKSIRMVIP